MIEILALVALKQATGELTLDIPACRAEVLAEKIGQAAHQNIQVAANLKDEVLSIRVKNVKIDVLLSRMAGTLYAQAREVPGGYIIEQTPTTKSQEEFDERATRLARMKKILADKAAELAKTQPLTKTDLQTSAQKMTAMQDEMQKAGSDQARIAAISRKYAAASATMASLSNRVPVNRLLLRLMQNLDPAALAELGPTGRIVFATNPTRMQRPLQGAGPLVSDFIREQREVAAIASALPKAKPPARSSDDEEDGSEDVENLQYGFDTRQPDRLGKLHLIVTYGNEFFGGGISFQLNVLGTDGNVLFQASASAETSRGIMGMQAPDAASVKKDDRPLPLSDETKKIVQSFRRDASTGMFPDDMKKRFLSPLKNEPLGVYASDFLVSAYADNNVVARMPDSMLMFTIVGAERSDPTVAVERAVIESSNEVTIETAAGWTTIKPKLSLTERFTRVDRHKLQNFVDARGSGFQAMDAYADAVHGLPAPTQNAVMMFTLFMDPDGAGFSVFGGDNWSTVQFYGALSAQQRRALRTGMPMRLGQLPAEAQNLLANDIYIKPDNLMPSAGMGDEAILAPDGAFQWNSLSSEPTESLPTGLPANTIVIGKLRTDQVLSASEGMSRVPLTAQELGAYLAYAESAPAGTPLIIDKDTKYRMGVRETLTMNFQFAPRLFLTHEMSWAGAMSGSYAFDKLPAEIQKAATEARKRIKEAGGIEQGAPARAVPPPSRA